MRKVFRPSSLLRLIISRNGSKRTRSRIPSGYLNDNILLQAISKDEEQFLVYFRTRWLVKKELFCKVWRSSTSFHTNNLIESYHNQLKTFYLGRARRRHCDSLIYTARNVDDRLPSGDFEVFVWFSNCQIKPKRCEKEKISVCF